jgi:hypothetical protein
MQHDDMNAERRKKAPADIRRSEQDLERKKEAAEWLPLEQEVEGA